MYTVHCTVYSYRLIYQYNAIGNLLPLAYSTKIKLCKNVMQGKLIAVAYTLRTYRNQFSLGGICKQEKRLKAFNFDSFENSHNSFLWTEYFIDYFCENGFHVRLRHPSCVYFSAQSAKNAYTSKITFLALVPCFQLPLPIPEFYRSLNIIAKYIYLF